jgi:hypothetical protein
MNKNLFAVLALCLLSLNGLAAYTVDAGKDWQPIEMSRTIESGSALDLSAWADTPAGKYGAVIATKDGHFAFAERPDRSVRFFGANLCFNANLLSKPDAEALALRFRQMGYNTLRIHHYDVLVAGGWHPAKYTINSAVVDKLDYLFYCMKKQGIYIATDLFTIRRINAESLAAYGVETDFGGFKALVPLLPEAMDEWKKFARDMLTHKNPYTGLTWAEDPSLFSINPINEDTLYNSYKQNKKVEALANRLFDEWCKANNHPCDPETRNSLFVRFLTEKHLAADREMSRFLKEDLGCKALLSGNNWQTYAVQTILRSEYDYVDNHRYWDHPAWAGGGPTSYPIRLPQKNAADHLAFVPRDLFLTRVMGKPFVVSEFNFCAPNQWRGQSGPLVGTYASLQGWDGLIRFNWYDGVLDEQKKPPVIRGFDMVNDPITLLSELVIGFFWRQQQVPELKDEAVFTVTDKTAFKTTPNGTPLGFPASASLVGLTRRVGSVYNPDGNAEQLNKLFLDHKEQSSYRVEQDGRTVEIEKPGNFLARTPQSIALCLGSRSLAADFVTDFQGSSTVFCGALDFQPLEKSERLLILHLSDVSNSGVQMSDEMRKQENMGTLPLLVKRASAQLAVPNEFKENEIKVYRLDMSGKRICEIPFTVNPKNNRIEFTAQTITENNQTGMIYEIVRAK